MLVRDPLGKFTPAAFAGTDGNLHAAPILAWYGLRWHVEVTFEESRAHLGLETHRQSNGLAIAGTRPALLGLFSLVGWLAQRLVPGPAIPTRSAACYTKREATFSDGIALVRRYRWPHVKFPHSLHTTRLVAFPVTVLDHLLDTAC